MCATSSITFVNKFHSNHYVDLEEMVATKQKVIMTKSLLKIELYLSTYSLPSLSIEENKENQPHNNENGIANSYTVVELKS